MPRFALLFLSIFALAGCAGSGPALVPNPELTISEVGEMPAPSASDFTEGVEEYVLGPLDKIKIEVFGIEEFSEREYQLDGSGSLTYPFAGTINASGMTVGELSRTIADQLRGRYVRDPQVSVNLWEMNSQTVAVEGSVKEPGLYPIRGRMTLTRAVASAQGLTEFSKVEQVVVLRTVSGQRYAALHDLRSIRQGLYEDPRIYANDVVIVGDSAARRRFRDIISVAAILAGPFVAVLNNTGN